MPIAANMIEWYKTNGFTLLDDAKPTIGEPVYGARLVIERGLGGVLLSTRRIGVPVVRLSELDYHDEINDEDLAGDSTLEAWKPLSAAMSDPNVAKYVATQA